MIVLGIDTAIRCTGYGILEIKDLNSMVVLDCGIIKNSAKLKHSECLCRIAGGIKELINNFNPEVAAIEDVFFRKNVKTVSILSMARGAAITALAEMGIPAYAYSPKSVKRAVVGNGNASKEQVAVILSTILGFKTEDIPLDATDALGMAMAHGQVAMRPELNMLLPKQI